MSKERVLRTDVSPHPFLKPRWTKPAVPNPFDRLVCCDYFDGRPAALDFMCESRKDGCPQFASEREDPAIEWPWVTDFSPTAKDWDSIGFLVLDCG